MPNDLQDSPGSMRQAIEMGVLVLFVVVFLTVSLAVQKPFAQTTPEGIMKALGIIVAAGLTLIMYSFLYRDNPLYKIAENLYVGVTLGYTAVVTWHQALRPEVYEPIFAAPTSESFYSELMYRIVPIVLGIMLLTRLSRKHGWISRYSYALMIGWFVGLNIPLTTHSYILKQLYAAVAPLQDAAAAQAATAPAGSQAWFLGTVAPIFGAAVVMIGTAAVLFYFFFSVEHKGIGRVASKTGIWFLMVAFGASFGSTVMARLSLLIGRVQFLLFEWLKIKGQ